MTYCVLAVGDSEANKTKLFFPWGLTVQWETERWQVNVWYVGWWQERENDKAGEEGWTCQGHDFAYERKFLSSIQSRYFPGSWWQSWERSQVSCYPSSACDMMIGLDASGEQSDPYFSAFHTISIVPGEGTNFLPVYSLYTLYSKC